MFAADASNFAIISFIFLAAGAVKGILGMGLPTVAMGLLGLIMPVAQAAALLIVPSLATNVWQMLRGGHLRTLWHRLWPLFAGAVLGVWAGHGFMAAGAGRHASLLLGVCLVAYAAAGLVGWRLARPAARMEKAMSAVVGVLTGLLTAATGVFVLPAVPYLQALDMDKDEMTQALGLSFTISTLALGSNLVAAGVFRLEAAAQSLAVLVPALAGMWLGQRVRDELSQEGFRRWLFGGLLVLGGWLVGRALWM
jgi:uncharacterized membrane protein YfcA